MHRRRALVLALSLTAPILPAGAQTIAAAADNAGPENVRTEYAQVLRAEPVYQTLRATSMVERCERATPVASGDGESATRRGVTRLLGAVKEVFTAAADDNDDSQAQATPANPSPARKDGCRMVPVDREFRRPIAFDVDYVHHGIKYRSRLPYDPGNRVRVRVSVTPISAPGGGD